MRAAAIYDIHGNLPALRRVLAEVARESVDLIVVGGDVASGPLPAETVEELMGLGRKAQFVCGNADREIVTAYDLGSVDFESEEDSAKRAAAFAASRISAPQRNFLAGFVSSVSVEIDELGRVLFCHGSPRSDNEMITTLTSDDRLREMLSGVEQTTVVCGHTHRQFDRHIDRWRVANAGSVGIPYEGRPGAYWALLGPDVELRRTDYDLHQAISELREGGFPDTDEMIRESLVDPANPDWVAEFYEQLATS